MGGELKRGRDNSYIRSGENWFEYCDSRVNEAVCGNVHIPFVPPLAHVRPPTGSEVRSSFFRLQTTPIRLLWDICPYEAPGEEFHVNNLNVIAVYALVGVRL